MANVVKGKYVEYYPCQFFREKAEEFYSNEKFDKEYESNPNKMTKEQIKLCGYDKLKDTLWSKYLDKKYESIYTAEFETANMVVKQILPHIKELCSRVKVEVCEGYLKKGYSPKVTLPRILIGEPMTHDKPEGRLTIFINLSEDKEKMFHISYETAYYCGERDVTDVELLGQIARYVKYIKYGEEPTSYPDKVSHWVENQYYLYSGKHVFKLYDVDMIQMYNTLAKACNEKFGTKFPYSQKMIDRLNKHEVHGNIHFTGGFYFKNGWYVDKFTLNEWYYYTDCGRCETTYGDDWTKEELCNIVGVLRPYVMNNYFFETSMKFLGRKYKGYDDIGVIYKSKPNYYKDLLWEE